MINKIIIGQDQRKKREVGKEGLRSIASRKSDAAC
jgi:hypothetical protein